MKLKTRETRLLGLLALAAVGFGWYRLQPLLLPSVPAGAGGPRAATARTVHAGAQKLIELEELRVADLEMQPPSYRAGRDPFRFGEPPPPQPPPPPTKKELEEMARRRAEEEEARRRLEAERLAEARRPHPPDLNVTFLGSFGPPTRRVAVFSDGANTYNALLGEVLQGKFIVDRIGFESVDVKFVGFPDVPPQRLAVGTKRP